MNYNQYGLLFDIAGVILLFIYGLPSKISEGDMHSWHESSQEEISRLKKNKKITIMAYLALGLIFIGFVLQFIGSSK